ncbi:quinone-dependent dihydroorotate dehydrogenase [Echinimonas agarilytica]|uniref:Dihydroorotate dehydrogenase (quinone) n=1 Tax=Echinimonas agarilytica TaxID=1215918 RepID=A0AA41W8G1_9GAMM|nr:quinone-dependent dihydroorotate dehydrogenase [Echinimonas agarilytica]MCM2681162.1 quinone-dependent dihydroorotate dehydrogenase [Echinimonas agarilytica]
MYYDLTRKILFAQDPEKAHDITIGMLKKIGKTPLRAMLDGRVQGSPRNVMGLDFANPVGLAAGLDKNGECLDAWFALGFGFVEIGTVTPLAQGGNDKPRLFRVLDAEGIINRMGFNNKGVDYLVEQVKQVKHRTGLVGINIGKNKDTPVEHGKDDYLICLNKVYEHADYVAVNISSPNTPGLRSMQYGDALDDLLASLKERQTELEKKHNRYVPIAVKIAPDMTHEEIAQTADSFVRHSIDGVIATNTTLSREEIKGLPHCDEAGGLSGKPLQLRSTEFVQRLSTELDGKLPIIGVGGIDSLASAEAKMSAGADLVQIYSGFIYKGPPLIHNLVKNLR